MTYEMKIARQEKEMQEESKKKNIALKAKEEKENREGAKEVTYKNARNRVISNMIVLSTKPRKKRKEL